MIGLRAPNAERRDMAYAWYTKKLFGAVEEGVRSALHHCIYIGIGCLWPNPRAFIRTSDTKHSG